MINGKLEESAHKSPWIICFCASLFFFYEFIQGNMLASIADNIMADFHIAVDKMTIISSIYYVANVIFLFFAGIILDRFSPKKIIIIAMFLCIISTFVLARAEHFYVTLIARFITGIGSAFCFLGPVRIASQWFEAKKMAFVAGVIVTIGMSGGFFAQYPLAYLVSIVGWRSALIYVGVLGLLMLFVMILGIKDKDQDNKLDNIPLVKSIKTAYLNSNTIKAAMFTSLMNIGIAVLGAMIGSLYLTQRMGISKEVASGINTYLFLGTILGGPIFGWISDRIYSRIRPMKYGVVFSFIIILLVMYATVSVFIMKILFFMLGFFAAAQVISYALVAESNPSMITAKAVSVISILTQSGYVVYQNLFTQLLIYHADGKKMAVYSIYNYQFAMILLPVAFMFAFIVVSSSKESQHYFKELA